MGHTKDPNGCDLQAGVYKVPRDWIDFVLKARSRKYPIMPYTFLHMAPTLRLGDVRTNRVRRFGLAKRAHIIVCAFYG